MAFQIIDDILDYSQTSDAFGKPVLEDVRQGVYTAPLIFALQENNKRLKELIDKEARMTEEEAKEVQQLVIELGGLEKAKLLAKKYTQKAMKRIEQLPEQLEKEQIKSITVSLLDRLI